MLSLFRNSSISFKCTNVFMEQWNSSMVLLLLLILKNSKMKRIIIIVITSIIMVSCHHGDVIYKQDNILSQMNDMDNKNIKTHLHEMGNDNLSVLNKTEGEFFNMFFSNRLNGLDLRNKSILFLMGSGGTIICNKKTIFNYIKDSFNRDEIPLSVAWQLFVCPQDIVYKTGFDAVIVYGMKKKITSKHILKVLHQK